MSPAKGNYSDEADNKLVAIMGGFRSGTAFCELRDKCVGKALHYIGSINVASSRHGAQWKRWFRELRPRLSPTGTKSRKTK